MGFLKSSDAVEKKLGEFFEVDLKKKIKQTEKKFQTVFESTNDMILFLDKNGIIIDVNKVALELSGLQREFFIGKKIKELNEFIKKSDLDKISKKKNLDNIEVNTSSKSKKKLNLNVNSIIMKEEGRTVGRVLVFKDVTAKKEIEKLKIKTKQESEINKIRTNFLRMISHELRHPLVPIIGYASVMLEENPSKIQQGYLEKILNNSNKLKELLNKILYTTSLEAGQVASNLKDINLKTLTNKVLLNYENKFKNKGIKFSKRFEIKDKIKLDEQMIERALINLFENCLSYTDKGRVSVFVKENQKGAIINVKYTGKSMSEQELSALNKGVLSIDEQKIQQRISTGLGLNFILINLITKHHEGDFKINSNKNLTEVVLTFPKK